MNDTEKKELFYLRIITVLLLVLTITIIVVSVVFLKSFLQSMDHINESLKGISDTIQSLNLDGDAIQKLMNAINSIGSIFS